MTDAPDSEVNTTRSALDSVLEAEEEMERRVKEAGERAEQQVKQARLAGEASVTRDKERIAGEVAGQLETRKRLLDEELAREAHREEEMMAGRAAGLGPVRDKLRKRILDLIIDS